MKIYFGGAVRGGGASHEALAIRIAQLGRFGRVLTEHMARPDPAARSDREIHDRDQELLEQADVFVADVTVPSTGTGYMIARACARGIPTVCLYARGAKASAMVVGSPDVATRCYADDADFIAQVAAFFVERRLRTQRPWSFLAGPPGSGKGTLGARLAETTGAIHVSTGEVLRALPAAHPHAAAIAADMAAGRLVPAAIMREIVAERLARPECGVFGVILDGYPPSLADLENLAALGIVPDVVLYLDVSDATAVARQVGRAARSTDTDERARDRVATFHQANAGYRMLCERWYPHAVVARIDAERSPAHVLASALAILDGAAVHHASSYFAVGPANPRDVRGTRVHCHIDGPSHERVAELARAVSIRYRAAQGQLKVYPIDGLALGPQHGRHPIYRRLPNFHAIDEPGREAFVTGKLGDGDRALVQCVLETVRDAHVGPGYMVELEEYVGEWTLGADGVLVADATYEPLGADFDHPDFAAARAPGIPRWELHHGFDLAKATAAPPIALPDLVAACAELGLDNGGWFLFANERHWAYRCNEFRDGDEREVTAALADQARRLSAMLAARGHACAIGYSLELVHGIWLFD